MAWWFIFRKNELLMREDVTGTPVPNAEVEGLALLRRHHVGQVGDAPCYAAEVAPEAEAPSGMLFQGLRAAHGRLGADLFRMGGRAFQIVEWDRNHQFCGRCGSPTELKADEVARRCPQCGLMQFPRLSPAVIVLIRRGDEILLARSPHFAPGIYSTIAGFVEPGETLEDAVRREVAEEVGVQVTNLRYFGSQPWPFPHSLMVGFTADWAGGEIEMQEQEIEDARWFTRETLPGLPSSFSIAHALIQSYLQE